MFRQVTIMCIQLQYKCEIMDMCTYHYTSNLQNIAFWAKTSISIYVTIQTRKYMHAETLADKTIVFSEREVFKVVVMITQ